MPRAKKMTRAKKRILTATIVCCAAAGMFAAGIFCVRTEWFRGKLRQRLITRLERATGARVDIGTLRFDWHTLTLDLSPVMMHGTEPSGNAPLFRADEVRVTLKLASVLRGSLVLESLDVTRPQVNLLVHPDGSTNVPAPARDREGAQTVMDLRIHKLAIQDGTLQVNLRRTPIRMQAQEIALACNYEPNQAAYDVHFSSNDAVVEKSGGAPLRASAAGRISISRNLLAVRSLEVRRGLSNLNASGTISNFAKPEADFSVSGRLRAADAAGMLGVPSWRAGEIAVRGAAQYHSGADITVRGHISGHDLAYRANGIDIADATIDSDLSGSPEDVEFTNVIAGAFGARLAGHATLLHRNHLDVDGRVSRLSLQRAASIAMRKRLDYDALLNGRVQFAGEIAAPAPRGVLRAELTLNPTGRGTPVSGQVALVYRTPARIAEFGASYVDLPGTHLSFSGSPSATMQVALNSSNLAALSLPTTFPVLDANGNASFNGTVSKGLTDPEIAGEVSGSNFEFQGEHWDYFRSQVHLSKSAADFTPFCVKAGGSQASGNLHAPLQNWEPQWNGVFQLSATFDHIDLNRMPRDARAVIFRAPLLGNAVASGWARLSGSIAEPQGTAQVRIDSSMGPITRAIQAHLTLNGDNLQIDHGQLHSGPAHIAFSGRYTQSAGSWNQGRLNVKIDSNRFPLAAIPEWQHIEPGISANAEIHGAASVRIVPAGIEPVTADGVLRLRDIVSDQSPLGELNVNAVTVGERLKADLTGSLRGHPLTGAAQARLTEGTPFTGQIHFDRLNLAALSVVLFPRQNQTRRVDGNIQGGITFAGPLLEPSRWQSTLRIDQMELQPKLPEAPSPAMMQNLVLRNTAPVIVDASDGTAVVHSFGIRGVDTALTIGGSVHYNQQPRSRQAVRLDLRANGSMNMDILELLDPGLRSAGQALVAASIGGTMNEPTVTGTLDVRHGTIFLAGLPNGLTNVNGRILFTQRRASIQELTAETGGGALRLGGFVSFGGGGPLVYHVDAAADDVRLRYPAGISVTAKADLRLTGSSDNGILSGTATVSRVVFSSNTDVGNLLAGITASTAAPANENEFAAGLHLDVAIQSAPNLQLNTALSRDVEADIDVRLRGTLDHPVLLGGITANQGDIKVFGTKYSINRGEVSFQNTARIEPVLDLDLQTRTRGITVNITISGTMNRLNIAYRSDPPLQPRDIIALLTVGRAPQTSVGMRTAQTADLTALQSNPSTVLGQAVSPQPSRLSKLFGITNVKIDPMVQGIITNTPQARLTLEQQISRDLTVTYVTNLSQTAEQIFRVEWALNQQYSIVAIRDENGEFGIDIQYKKRFR